MQGTACADEKLMYISAENLEYHTAADIDAKVGTEFENADMLMSNIGIFGLPVAYTASHMAKRLSAENLCIHSGNQACTCRPRTHRMCNALVYRPS